MKIHSLIFKVIPIINVVWALPAQAQDNDPMTAELRPWCKIDSEEIHTRTQGTWMRTKVSYECEGLTVTMTGDKIGVVQYNH